jgi:hypothetical protein
VSPPFNPVSGRDPSPRTSLGIADDIFRLGAATLIFARGLFSPLPLRRIALHIHEFTTFRTHREFTTNSGVILA